MGCDSIATTISRMGKEPTTLGPEDLKGHRFSAFCLRSVRDCFSVLVFAVSAIVQRDQEVIRDFLPRYFFRVFFISNLLNFSISLPAWYRALPHGGGRAA